MYTTPTSPAAGNPHKRNWRKHSDEFKARVVAMALEPHASMASVALANGINAVDSSDTLSQRGCGVKLGLVYAAIPRLARYSRGLSEPKDTLMRFSLYQLM